MISQEQATRLKNLSERLSTSNDLWAYEAMHRYIDSLVAAAPPVPPHECKTGDEKRAFAFGWWKAMETVKPIQLPEPMTEIEIVKTIESAGIPVIDGVPESHEISIAHTIEAETLRRVKETNKQ